MLGDDPGPPFRFGRRRNKSATHGCFPPFLCGCLDTVVPRSHSRPACWHLYPPKRPTDPTWLSNSHSLSVSQQPKPPVVAARWAARERTRSVSPRRATTEQILKKDGIKDDTSHHHIPNGLSVAGVIWGSQFAGGARFGPFCSRSRRGGQPSAACRLARASTRKMIRIVWPRAGRASPRRFRTTIYSASRHRMSVSAGCILIRSTSLHLT